MVKSAAEIIREAEESLVTDILNRGESAAGLYKQGKFSAGNKILQKGFERVTLLTDNEDKASTLLSLATIYNDNRDAIMRSGLNLG